MASIDTQRLEARRHCCSLLSRTSWTHGCILRNAPWCFTCLPGGLSPRSLGAGRVYRNSSHPVQCPRPRSTNHDPGAKWIGFEFVNATGQRDGELVPCKLLAVVAQQGGVVIAGVYTGGENNTAGAANAATVPTEQGCYGWKWNVFPLEHARSPINLVVNDRASPSFVVSFIIDVEQAPEYYRRYSDLLEHKIVICFP
ncbi:alcohol dehydrogenase [Penicillium antarcticum]|uniref:alcohol dehydrogenase n=1 Tax=Penicillium antarcticum TaxID=416450 RepID=UPI00239D57F3|nr:alcohol dehydrogenase [Penicillium antarcticum]KAJ5305920.1 alcohol dehydrogenase [Penicillium antarcticum]